MSDLTLEEMINKAYEIRAEYRAKYGEADELKAIYQKTEYEILERLDNIGLTGGKSHSVSATISESFLPVIDDYDALKAHVIENDAWFLLRRQVNVGPYTESHKAGLEIPGVSHAVRRSLNLRRLKG